MRDEWIDTEERDEEILIRAVHTNFSYLALAGFKLCRGGLWDEPRLEMTFLGTGYFIIRPKK